jgi:hypothetical protein
MNIIYYINVFKVKKANITKNQLLGLVKMMAEKDGTPF